MGADWGPRRRRRWGRGGGGEREQGSPVKQVRQAFRAAALTLFRSRGVAEVELEEEEEGVHGIMELVYLMVMGGHEEG
jgi:hypothetical protein